MKAMVMTAFGPSSVLALRDMPRPEPGEHDLLIEVRAAGLNPVDTKIRHGMLGKDRALPFILGFDVSGVVRGKGAKAAGFADGDEVYASPSLARHGANAPFVAVDARSVARKPKSLSHAQTAALPLVTLTAWESLHDRARIRAGQTVLIHAGAGGVGHIAVQLAKAHGCRVITTAGRNESIAFCKQLGADVVINYRTDDVLKRVMQETNDRGCPVVLDTVGGSVFELSMQCVGLMGQLVSIVYSDTSKVAELMFRKSATLHMEFMGVPTIHNINPEHQAEILTKVGQMVDAGTIKPHVGEVIALEQLPAAHDRQEAGHTMGKIVVQM